MNVAKTSVLIIGFNRPNLIINRLHELLKISGLEIVVSIDGSTRENFETYDLIRKEFEHIWNNDASITWKFRENNLGLVDHVHTSISEILELNNSIIVIEDDISINESTIRSLEYGIRIMENDKSIASVGSFSPLTLPRALLFLNRFRRSKYFACWGWATTKEIWAKYEITLNHEDIHKMMADSITWRSLTSNQQATWVGRFNRVIQNPSHTWDTQFQFMSFKNNKVHLLPISTLSKNVGFNDPRAVHTVGRRPNWMSGGAPDKRVICNQSKSKFIQFLMEFVESNTLIGDSQLLVRFMKILRRAIRIG